MGNKNVEIGRKIRWNSDTIHRTIPVVITRLIRAIIFRI